MELTVAIAAFVAALLSLVLHLTGKTARGFIAGAFMLALLGVTSMVQHHSVWLPAFEFAVAAVTLISGVKKLRTEAHR
jgi:hypothetical protein